VFSLSGLATEKSSPVLRLQSEALSLGDERVTAIVSSPKTCPQSVLQLVRGRGLEAHQQLLHHHRISLGGLVEPAHDVRTLLVGEAAR
jgi:hypothetical protein